MPRLGECDPEKLVMMRRSALVEWQNFTAEKFNFISDIENGDPLFEDIDKVITYHKENPGDSLLDIYWEIGQYIVMYEQYGNEKAQYGENASPLLPNYSPKNMAKVSAVGTLST